MNAVEREWEAHVGMVPRISFAARRLARPLRRFDPWLHAFAVRSYGDVLMLAPAMLFTMGLVFGGALLLPLWLAALPAPWGFLPAILAAAVAWRTVVVFLHQPRWRSSVLVDVGEPSENVVFVVQDAVFPDGAYVGWRIEPMDFVRPKHVPVVKLSASPAAASAAKV